MITRLRPLLAAAFGLLLLASPLTRADDTEVFFNALDTQEGGTAPNVLFLLDTGYTMNQNLGGDPTEPTRLWIMKDALIKVLQGLVNNGVRVNVGIMRMAVNGTAGQSAAAKGGVLIRPVEPLTQDLVKDWTRVLCLNNKDKPTPLELDGCDTITDNNGKNPVPIFATPQQTNSGSAASPVTEMLSEAYQYFSGGTPQWGQNALVGPGYQFPLNVISASDSGCGANNCSIHEDAALRVADCVGNSNTCKYKSPARASCVNNYIVILSNGVFSVDTGNDTSAGGGGVVAIPDWPTFNAYTGANTVAATRGRCSTNPYTADYKPLLPPGGSSKLSDCPDDAVNTMRVANFNVAGVPGVTKATVTTYVVAFDVDSSVGSTDAVKKAAYKHLDTIASAGGTALIATYKAEELVGAFQGIIEEVVIDNASFSSPSVAVNAFNQLQNLNDLYFAVFSPDTTARWKGNVKKYRIDPSTGDIKDAKDQVAVKNGFFSGSSQSIWSIQPEELKPARPLPDGADAASGGAASQLPSVKSSLTNRKLLTNFDGAMGDLSALAGLASAASVIDEAGDSVTPAKFLGISCTPVLTTTFPTPPADPLCPTATDLVEWAYGRDVACQTLPNNTGDPIPKRDAAGNPIKDASGNDVILYPRQCDRNMTRFDMGDLLHGKPAVVTYDVDTTDKSLTQYLFGVTNDGYLHAIDVDTGEEKWAFMPWDLADRLLPLYKNGKINPRTSLGLDSPVKVLRIDAGNDNIIDPGTRGSNINDLSKGDHVYLFFGMRRGGSNYYAVDVTDINNPRLVWRITPEGTESVVSGVGKPSDDFKYLGQTWSTPQITRIAVPVTGAKVNNPNNWVLVFGGGYDPAEDHLATPTTPQGYIENTVGNGIYIVNAATGELLWRAGKDSGADLQLDDGCPGSTGSGPDACMNNAIPGDVRVIELTAPVSADLLYAADLGGRVWRFQINKSATNLSDFIRGGVLAYLGGGSSDSDGTLPENARRFFVAPDVSWITLPNGTLSLNVALGSGNREMPILDTVTEDRFYSMREPYPINWSRDPILDENLYDLRTADVDTSSLTYPGWKLTLYQAGDPQNGLGAKVVSESRTFQNTLFFSSFVPIKNPLYNSNECAVQLGVNNLYQVDVFDGSGKIYNPRNLATTADSRAVTLNQGGIAPEVQFIFPSSPLDEDGKPKGPPPKPVCLAGAESCGQFGGYEPVRTYWRQDKTD